MQPSYLFLYHLPWRKASIVLEIRPRIASSASDASPSSGTYSGSGVRSCGAGAVVVSAGGKCASRLFRVPRLLAQDLPNNGFNGGPVYGRSCHPYRLRVICKVGIVENDCIGDILCFPVVRLFFQQFDRCQMDWVADIEPQGKTPAFFLGRHSCHLPAASRRYRYSYPAALALILETNNGLPTFPDASICRRKRMAPPPTKTTVQ